jgi:hypothetical protein
LSPCFLAACCAPCSLRSGKMSWHHCIWWMSLQGPYPLGSTQFQGLVSAFCIPVITQWFHVSSACECSQQLPLQGWVLHNVVLQQPLLQQREKLSDRCIRKYHLEVVSLWNMLTCNSSPAAACVALAHDPAAAYILSSRTPLCCSLCLPMAIGRLLFVIVACCPLYCIADSL